MDNKSYKLYIRETLENGQQSIRYDVQVAEARQEAWRKHDIEQKIMEIISLMNKLTKHLINERSRNNGC